MVQEVHKALSNPSYHMLGPVERPLRIYTACSISASQTRETKLIQRFSGGFSHFFWSQTLKNSTKTTFNPTNQKVLWVLSRNESNILNIYLSNKENTEFLWKTCLQGDFCKICVWIGRQRSQCVAREGFAYFLHHFWTLKHFRTCPSCQPTG